MSVIERDDKMPERVWLAEFLGEREWNRIPPDDVSLGAIEYVRADLHAGAVEALEEIIALEKRTGDLGEGPGYWGAISECAAIARKALGRPRA